MSRPHKNTPQLIMLTHFEQMLDDLSQLAGMGHCLHDLTGFTSVKGRRAFGKNFYQHTHPFCLQVKMQTGPKCLQNDFEQANRRAGKSRQPFIKKCHAGVLEVAVPVWVGNNHLGTLFLGPMREKGTRLRCGEIDALQLPERTRAELRQVGRLAGLLSGYVAQAAEALALQQAETKVHSESIRQALRYAAENYAQPLSVEAIAKQVFLSASRFAHLFSSEVGVSFHEYLITLRIDRAKMLLLGSTLRIAEISARTGFCNQNYFTNVFGQRTGTTPTEFRRLQQKSIDI